MDGEKWNDGLLATIRERVLLIICFIPTNLCLNVYMIVSSAVSIQMIVADHFSYQNIIIDMVFAKGSHGGT